MSTRPNNVDNVTLTSPSNIANQKTRSNIIIRVLENSMKRTIHSVEILEVEKERDDTLNVLVLCYGFVYDVRSAIDRLQFLVIKTFDKGSTQPELSKIAAFLSNLTNSIEQSYTDKASLLKTKLLQGLQDVVQHARSIQTVITSSSDEVFRNDAGIILDDILFSIERVYYYNVYEKKSMKELQKAVNDSKNSLLAEATGFNAKTDPESVRDITAVEHYAIRKMYFVTKILDEEADCYEGKLKYSILQISHNINVDLELLDVSMRRKEDLSAIEETIRICTRTCHDELITLALLGNPSSPDRKISHNFHYLILITSSYIRATLEVLVHNLKIIHER